MKTSYSFCFVPLLIGSTCFAAGRVLTLPEAFSLALKQSETIAQSAATADEARARVDELTAAVLPVLSLNATELLQGVPADVARRDTPEVGVSVHQPLFSGFKEFSALKAGRSLSRSASLDLLRAEHLLYQDVAQAFLQVAQLQKEENTRAAVLSITRDRLKEILHREHIGLSRTSERLSVEALVANLEAAQVDELRQERQAQRALRFLTGLKEDVNVQVPDIRATPSLSDAMKRASGRPDVSARRMDFEGAGYALDAARRDYWPTLTLDGDSYFVHPGPPKNIDWDLLFSGHWAFYRGGAWRARRNEAAAAVRGARAAYDLAERQSSLDVETAYDTLTTTLEEVPVWVKAQSLANANAKAQTEDYRRGLVTNLDVLTALESLQQAGLQVEETRLQSVLADVQLQVATGDVPVPNP